MTGSTRESRAPIEKSLVCRSCGRRLEVFGAEDPPNIYERWGPSFLRYQRGNGEPRKLAAAIGRYWLKVPGTERLDPDRLGFICKCGCRYRLEDRTELEEAFWRADRNGLKFIVAGIDVGEEV